MYCLKYGWVFHVGFIIRTMQHRVISFCKSCAGLCLCCDLSNRLCLSWRWSCLILTVCGGLQVFGVLGGHAELSRKGLPAVGQKLVLCSGQPDKFAGIRLCNISDGNRSDKVNFCYRFWGDSPCSFPSFKGRTKRAWICF